MVEQTSEERRTSCCFMNQLLQQGHLVMLVEFRKMLLSPVWEQAKAPLEKLIELYPGDAGDESPYLALATAHRKLGETDKEMEVLGKLAATSGDAASAYKRVMDIAAEQEDWEVVAQNAQRYLAVYPMLATTYQMLGRASESLQRQAEAIDAYERLLALKRFHTGTL